MAHQQTGADLLAEVLGPLLKRKWSPKKIHELLGLINDAVAETQAVLSRAEQLDSRGTLADFLRTFGVLSESMMSLSNIQLTAWDSLDPSSKVGRRLTIIRGTLKLQPNAEDDALQDPDRYKTEDLGDCPLVHKLLIVTPWQEFLFDARDLCELARKPKRK